MEVTAAHRRIDDPSMVGAARRLATELARAANLDEADAARAALIVTETATNLLKHAGGGELLLATIDDPDARGLDVVALDRGPGIADLGEAMRDGFSSAGTPGNGLGAVARLASVFDLYSRRGGGTAVFARICAGAPPRRQGGPLVGGVNVAYPGEPVSGDQWVVRRLGTRNLVLVADGLGHGILAHEAARTASAAFQTNLSQAPAAILTGIHEALRATRGAAVAVAEIDPDRGLVRFAGLGNIAGTILVDGTTRSVVSHHGTAGHDMHRVQEFTYPWSQGATLVLHSDGLMSRWTLDAYPGLLARHPTLSAGMLYRDFCRGRDDTTVVVVRDTA